jgi:hypothetical protein
MSILTHRSEGQLDRDIQIHVDVYALGFAILEGNSKETCRTVLDEMEDMDWVPVPYSLARALHSAITVAVLKRLPYVGTNSLLDWDENKGVLKLSPLGDAAVKKMMQSIRSKL